MKTIPIYSTHHVSYNNSVDNDVSFYTACITCKISYRGNSYTESLDKEHARVESYTHSNGHSSWRESHSCEQGNQA